MPKAGIAIIFISTFTVVGFVNCGRFDVIQDTGELSQASTQNSIGNLVTTPGQPLDVIIPNDATIVKFPQNGTLTGANPKFIYRPNPGFRGKDSFSYIKLSNSETIKRFQAQGSASSEVTTVTIQVAPEFNPYGIRVGAIRWDAWYGDSYASPKVTQSLSPRAFWSRIPFFGKIKNDVLETIDGNSSIIMDRELTYANRAGIDYWAFLDYPIDGGLDIGLKLYLSQVNSKNVGFAMILNSWSYNQAISAASGTTWLQTAMSRFLDSRYETVLNGRPIIYVFDDICSQENRKSYCSPWLFGEITKKIKEKKGVVPYYIYLTSNVQGSIYDMRYLKMDAASVYAVTPSMLGYTAGSSYNQFQVKLAESYLSNMIKDAQSNGFDMVPFASAGWNPTPRFACGENCWGNYYGTKEVAEMGSAVEIANHIKSVAMSAQLNKYTVGSTGKTISPAGTMLIYAWNEFDEGGWLAPTLGADLASVNTDRIDALQKVLRPSRVDVVVPENTCTSFTYSAYGQCQSSGTKTRSVASRSPASCTGGNPSLSQSCTFVATECAGTQVVTSTCKQVGYPDNYEGSYVSTRYCVSGSFTDWVRNDTCSAPCVDPPQVVVNNTCQEVGYPAGYIGAYVSTRQLNCRTNAYYSDWIRNDTCKPCVDPPQVVVNNTCQEVGYPAGYIGAYVSTRQLNCRTNAYYSDWIRNDTCRAP